MKKVYKIITTVACICLIAGCGSATKQDNVESPNPEFVKVVNPLVSVASVEEMEQYLDFAVPTLEKEVESYIVLVLDGYPEIGRIRYADGGVFNKKFGSGDISGIYGGVLEKTEKVDGVTVSYYTYESTRYAIWEKGGFAYSLTGDDRLEEEVNLLMK